MKQTSSGLGGGIRTKVFAPRASGLRRRTLLWRRRCGPPTIDTFCTYSASKVIYTPNIGWADVCVYNM
jgi:hypothetical protein